MTKHTCSWVVKPASSGRDAIYCGHATMYTMVRDDDENKVRKYDHLCPEHRAKQDAMPPQEDEELD